MGCGGENTPGTYYSKHHSDGTTLVHHFIAATSRVGIGLTAAATGAATGAGAWAATAGTAVGLK